MRFEIEWDFEQNNPTISGLIIGGMKFRSSEGVLPVAGTGVSEDTATETGYPEGTIGFRPALQYEILIKSINRLFAEGDLQMIEVTFGETGEALLLEKEATSELSIRYAPTYENKSDIQYGPTKIHADTAELAAALVECYEELVEFARQNDVPIDSQMKMLAWETKAAERLLSSA